MTKVPPAISGRAQAGSRMAPLDGLRAVAILAVLAYHYTIRWTPPHSDTDLYPYHGFFNGWPLLNYGWAGVELFFVISGFVICMTLERSAGLLDFARRRFARLWPAMLVCASLTMLIAQFGPAQWRVGPTSFLLSIFFLEPGFIGGLIHKTGLGWVDGVYWTLWIEVRFYVMAAVLFALFRKRFLSALTVVMLVSFVAGLRGFNYPERGWAWILLLPTFLPYFVFGSAIFRLNAAGRLTPTAGVAAALSTLIILIQGWLSFEYPAGGPIGFALINLVIIAAFLLFALGSPILKPFGWRPLARLGEASYSLYLIHSVVGIVMIEQLSKIMPWPLALGIATAAMIGLSLELFRRVEGPGKRLILKLTAINPSTALKSGSSLRPSTPRVRAADPVPSTIANG
jgi:peptidoglycan/LPS O-acetylase OafA/YrhL